MGVRDEYQGEGVLILVLEVRVVKGKKRDVKIGRIWIKVVGTCRRGWTSKLNGWTRQGHMVMRRELK